ncbi:MAG TPA: OsmC family protein, partial [Blastocatellia bacterium]|nr:OsmC family protein [Blastocatellia bacterium]
VVGSIGFLKQEIAAGEHKLVADEPVAAGGSDAGPDPYSYLLAALGACTSMTLQLYAKHKGWPLEKVEVSLRNQDIYAKDCEDCETRDGKITQIDRYISLTGPLTGEQKSRLLEIARRCPVHRTLTSEIVIKDHAD